MYTHVMGDDERVRAEQLLMLSSGARRIADVVAAAWPSPVRYEVMRHLMRMPEEAMIGSLDEAVSARLVRRSGSPSSYVSWDAALAAEIAGSMPPDRLDRMRRQIASASERVFEGDAP